MKTDYSKQSADIALETEGWRKRDTETLARQRAISAHLKDAPRRAACLLCGAALDGADCYHHRGIAYLICTRCTHLQTEANLPEGYPHAMAGAGFEAVYLRLDRNAYASRRDRIYAPKLDWVLSRMSEVGRQAENALRASWLELGCGAGYFLDALRAKGVVDFLGLDVNRELIAVAQEVVGEAHVRVTEDLLTDLEEFRADIVVAWFVLEHLEDAARFWHAMAEKPAGTLCLFAVPTVGFATVVEGAFDGFAARNLDSVLHTQLYTDRSLDFVLRMSGYEMVAEWLFGQDGSDLCRVLADRVEAAIPRPLGADMATRFAGLADSFQAVIDRARLCDARHVLAVKR